MLFIPDVDDSISVLHAKALYYQETLCRKEDIQKFLSSLVSKKPEVGHLVKCFHLSKSPDTKTNSGGIRTRVEHSHWSRSSRSCPLIGPDPPDPVLSLVQIIPDPVLSLAEPYYAGAKVYVITTHLKDFRCVVMA